MKKNYANLHPVGIAAAVLFLFTFTSQAQVKIGWPTGAADPSAVLDASNTAGGNKGFLAPQVALTALNAAGPVTAPANGLLVYNTATAGTSPNNVMPGYYYWNGTQWVMIIGSTMPNPSGNIYTNDGTLAGNRTVTMGANSLNFAGTNGNLAIATTGNVGVGTTTPAATLDVNGTARVQTVNQASAANAVSPLYVDASGNLLKSNASGTFGSSTANFTAVLPPGGTGILATNLADGGMYKAIVTVSDPCADMAMAEYYINSNSANNWFAINGIGGIIGSGISTQSPVFSRVNNSTISTTWSKTGCNAEGSNNNTFNYTLTLTRAAAFTLSITNNGPAGRFYFLMLTRIY